MCLGPPRLRPLPVPEEPDPVLLSSALARCNLSISMSSDRTMSVLSMGGEYSNEQKYLHRIYNPVPFY